MQAVAILLNADQIRAMNVSKKVSFYESEVEGDHDRSDEKKRDKEENKLVPFVSSSHRVYQLVGPTETAVHGRGLPSFLPYLIVHGV